MPANIWLIKQAAKPFLDWEAPLKLRPTYLLSVHLAMRLFILVQQNNELVFSDTIYLWASNQAKKKDKQQKTLKYAKLQMKYGRMVNFNVKGHGEVVIMGS